MYSRVKHEEFRNSQARWPNLNSAQFLRPDPFHPSHPSVDGVKTLSGKLELWRSFQNPHPYAPQHCPTMELLSSCPRAHCVCPQVPSPPKVLNGLCLSPALSILHTSAKLSKSNLETLMETSRAPRGLQKTVSAPWLGIQMLSWGPDVDPACLPLKVKVKVTQSCHDSL